MCVHGCPGGYEKSRQILETTCRNLNFPVPRLAGERHSTLKMYLDSNSSQAAQSGHIPIPASRRGPLPLPPHFETVTMPTGATSLDKDLYACASDFERHPPSRPDESLAEYVEPNEQIVRGRNASKSFEECVEFLYVMMIVLV